MIVDLDKRFHDALGGDRIVALFGTKGGCGPAKKVEHRSIDLFRPVKVDDIRWLLARWGIA